MKKQAIIPQAVRGAIQIARDEEHMISEGVHRLIDTICTHNDIAECDIISIIFSLTPDLAAVNPAACLRRYGFAEVALFCVQDLQTTGDLPRVIRVLLNYRAAELTSPRPIYLDGAAQLRPDIPHPSESSPSSSE